MCKQSLNTYFPYRNVWRPQNRHKRSKHVGYYVHVLINRYVPLDSTSEFNVNSILIIMICIKLYIFI
jgi:hypothetical protein